MLVVLGLIVVYSSSYALGYAQFGDANFFIKRQALSALIGLLGLLLAMNIDYRRLMRLSPLLMLASVLALGAVLLPGVGVEQNGASRWVAVGPLPPIQPSEFAKLAVLIYMAAWLAAKGDVLRDVALGVIPFHRHGRAGGGADRAGARSRHRRAGGGHHRNAVLRRRRAARARDRAGGQRSGDGRGAGAARRLPGGPYPRLHLRRVGPLRDRLPDPPDAGRAGLRRNRRPRPGRLAAEVLLRPRLAHRRRAWRSSARSWG